MDKLFDVDDLVQENNALRCELRNVLVLTSSVRVHSTILEENRLLMSQMKELQQKVAYYAELVSILHSEAGSEDLSSLRDAKADAMLFITTLRSQSCTEITSPVNHGEKFGREVEFLQRNLQGELAK